jgi:Trypsin-like peptidase domain
MISQTRADGLLGWWRGGRKAPKFTPVMPNRTPAKSNRWRPVTLCLAMILFNPPMIPAGANQTETPGPWIVTAKITRNEQESATAIYLKPGLVVTAAHLTPNWTGELSVQIAGAVLPGNLVKQGEFEEVDLSLFSVDDQKLPERVARIQTSLCQAPPWPGDPVIVVDHAGATRSHIVAPQILPLGFRTKFHTLIGDVASTGNSGSGVFDPNRKCLLGIMSRKFVVGGKDVAKYFVPASEIREFIPIERRDQVLIN